MKINNKYKKALGKIDSELEKRLLEEVFCDYPEAQYHPNKIKYTVEHTYTTDFLMPFGSKEILFESKGVFVDSPDAGKYPWIAKALLPHQELVFIFQKPDEEMWFRSKRKDGTKQTLAEWADLNGFRWVSEKDTKEFIENERSKQET